MKDMTGKDLITVIVPAYNVEEYLSECLDSALNQTYSNLEIIVVDDGSKDNTGKIADDYAKKDERTRVIHKENGGLSSARNAAIEVMKGKYFTLLDSDDYLVKDCIEILHDNIVENDCDIAGIVDAHDETSLGQGGNVNVYPKEEAIDRYLVGAYSEASCCKLYKSELFKDIRFPEGKIHEDTFTTYRVLEKTEKVCTNDYRGYYYRVREDSITNLTYTDRNYDKVEACRIINDFYKGTTHEFRAYNKYLSALLYFIVRTNGLDVPKNKTAKDELLGLLKKNGFKNVRAKLLPFMIAFRTGLLNSYKYK